MQGKAVQNNHEAVLISSTEQFVKGWFNQSLTEITPLLNDFFILPQAKSRSKGQVETRIKKIFKQCEFHHGGRFEIIDSNINIQEGQKGMAAVEGVAGFRAVNGTKSKIVSGPFKLFFALENDQWKIVHIVFPDFEY